MNVAAFFDLLVVFFDEQFLEIFFATMGLFIIMFITWWIYRKLSQRNIFTLFKKTMTQQSPTGWDLFSYIMKFFLLFPLLVFMGFLIFAFSLFLLAKPATAEAQATMLFAAIVVVSTIRIGAYVNESLAEDLAKLIPLSMLGIVLTHPQFSGIGITVQQIYDFGILIPGFLKYLLFTVILEGALRGGTWLFGNLSTETDIDAPAKK